MATGTKVQDTLPVRRDRPSSVGSLESDKAEKSNLGRIATYLKREISLQHADIPIIACCVVSGLCDSSAYNAWNCFVSMQTGMTITAL